MKLVISVNNLVIDAENLPALDALLAGATEQQNYDYNSGNYVYYLHPAVVRDVFTVNLLPDDLAEAQRLVWKLKQDEVK